MNAVLKCVGEVSQHTPAPVATNRPLYIQAYSTDDYADHPLWIRIDDPVRLIERVKRMTSFIKENYLAEVAASLPPLDIWDNQDEFRIAGEQLRVSEDSFWCQAYCKHANGHIETRTMGLETLERLCATDTKIIIHPDDDDFQICVEEAEEHFQESQHV